VAKKKVIIIGAGHAGLSAYEVLARKSDLCQVTIVSEESHLRYSPTDSSSLLTDLAGLYPLYGLPLSPFLKAEKVSTGKNALGEEQAYPASDCNHLILKKRAIKIIPREKKVLLEDGTYLSYEALIICTGARPSPFSAQWQEAANVFRLQSQVDVEKVLAVAKDARKAVIIGAGAVGIEAALSLVKQGLEVAVVEKTDQVMPGYFDSEAGKAIQSLLETKGLRFYLNSTIANMRQDETGRACSVFLADGKEMSCDLVVVATGVQANTDLVRDSGIEINRGILVNERMETSCRDIYAAGDVAEAKGIFPGEKTFLPTLIDAVEQGRIAAMNILDSNSAPCYQGGLPLHVLTLDDNILFSLGAVIKTDQYEVHSYISPERSHYLKLVFDYDRLVGAVGVNFRLPVGVIRQLILKKVYLGNYKSCLLEKPWAPDVWISTALARLWQNSH
jgi:phenylglyoxylate dehydrogenase epsilon subunit